MDDKLKIHMLEFEIKKLRNFIYVKGLAWDFVGYFGGDTEEFKRAALTTEPVRQGDDT